MITQEKVKIYKKYNGDIDGWARSGSRNEKLILSDNDWYLINGLIQDLALVKKGLASLSFIDDVDGRLNVNCDCDETIQVLKAIHSNENQEGIKENV